MLIIIPVEFQFEFLHSYSLPIVKTSFSDVFILRFGPVKNLFSKIFLKWFLRAIDGNIPKLLGPYGTFNLEQKKFVYVEGGGGG